MNLAMNNLIDYYYKINCMHLIGSEYVKHLRNFR